jgi:serine/threonine protein kinase
MIGATVGEGSFGKVLYGKHKATQREVAIKVVPKYSVAKHPHLWPSLMKERKILTRANNNSSIASLWASFHDEECLYLVMECAVQGNLSQAIKHGRSRDDWTEMVVPHYGLQLLQSLEYLHFELLVIHSDLKPDNIVVREDGRLQLADFGSAICMEERGTDENMPRGTADYAAPEIIKGILPLTKAVDLWSLGCVLCAMLTGESPFHAASDALAVKEVMTHAQTFNDSTSVNVPKDWKGLVLQLLHPDPLQRATGTDYALIRSHHVFRGVDVSMNPPYVPPRPAWWTESQTTPMRDGSLGWAVFLAE